MTTKRRSFGTSSDGAPVEEVVLANDRLTLSVISWGAIIRDLRPSSGPMAGRSLVLGFPSLDTYEAHGLSHFGAIVGRSTNRIRSGCFALDGEMIQLTRNTADGNHLHGGARGFGQRPWRVEHAADASVTLALSSPHGDEGYPGAVEVEVTYRIDGATVLTEMAATTDRPTIVNLAQHSYFNLDAGGDVRDHRLTVHAEAITPTDAALTPTGERRAVAGSVFDFRVPHTLRRSGAGYDVNYCLAERPRTGPAHGATLEGALHSVTLELWTTEPGLQLYDGGTIPITPRGIGGHPYGPYSGLCLEPQRWPDAPNHPEFPSSALRPGEAYRQHTEFRLSW